MVSKIIVMFTIIVYFQFLLNLFQQEHYDIKKYFKHTIKAYYCLKHLSIVIIAIILFKYSIIVSILVACCLVLYPKTLIKLKYTKRVIRITLLFITCLIILFHFNKVLIIYLLILLLLPFVLFIFNYLLIPLEKIINKYYYLKANNLIKNHPFIVKIAITGSFGKTSTKDVLTNLINKKYLTLATKKSYNTLLGIVKTINENKTSVDEVLIVEMGMNHLGEIKKMQDFVKSQVAIITDIGYQHLETLKTIENVLKAKLEIIDENTEYIIVNYDNQYLKEFAQKQTKYQVITFSINSQDADFVATNICYHKNYTIFDIYRFQKLFISVKTKLVGKHNVYNVMASVACLLSLSKYGIQYRSDILKQLIETIEPIQSRLVYKKINNWEILDDSYNSNIKGFKNAIDILALSNSPKFIITPGIVDNGLYSQVINEEIAELIIRENITTYLIKNPISEIIRNYFEKHDYHNYIIYPAFNKAYEALEKRYQLEVISLLIANDLPDNYLRRSS